MGIGVLGTLTLDEESASLGRRDRVVLTALATRAGHVVSHDLLVDALWHDQPPASAHKVVHGCVSRLRRRLGADAIQTAPPGYRLAVPGDAVDAVRFERAVARTRDLAAIGQVDRAAHLADEALALWRGRPFPDVDDWEPAVVEAMRLEEVRQEAQELRVDCYLRSGRHHEVLADAAALVREAPTREARWALLARAQYQDGRQADALVTLQQARDLLVDRLGIDPGPELDRLQEAVLRQDPGLLPGSVDARPSSERCPYRGLAAYDVEDEEGFFGRDREVTTCLGLVHAQGVLAVVGASGSGKSSLVRAGVAAALSRSGTRVHVLTPGDRPVHALDALPRRRGRDALVVDQCEEVFLLCTDPEERAEFLERLVAHAEVAPLVIALRADRLADLAPYASFARVVERGLHLLGGMDAEALRAVIETPARQSGLIVEPGLVDLLLREVEGEPGALPLLSHALRETWLRREGSTLTVAGYQAAGGIRGAVAQTAELVYGRVDPGLQHLVRELMLRLVTASGQGEPTRIRAPRSRVIVDPAQERLVEELVSARLLTSEEGAIEIAHESLARAWPRLRDWLADDVEGQRILHHVATAAEAWEALGRPDSELYRGARLQQTLEWRDRVTVELTEVENDFLDAGRSAAEAEERALVEHARQQARMIRRQRVALVAGSVFLALALAAGGVAMRAGERARAGEEAAETSARAADAGRIGAQSLTVEDPGLSILLAVEALRLEDNAQTRAYLREAMARRPALVASTEAPSRWVMNLSVDPRGGAAVGYTRDNQVVRFDLATGELTARADMDGPGRREMLYTPGALAYRPDGTMVAAGSQPFMKPSLVLLDPEEMTPLPEQPAGLPAQPAQASSVAFSPNGRWLAGAFVHTDADEQDPFGGAPSRLFAQVWDVEDLDAPPRVVELREGIWWHRVQVSDDGSTLYSGAPPAAYPIPDRGADPEPPTWRRDDLVSHGGFLVDLSPDGRWLLAPVEPRDLVVLDTRDGRTVRRFDGLGTGVFSPDGRVVAGTTGSGVVVRRWRSGTVVGAYEGAGAPVDFSADGTALVAAGFHGLETWDLIGDRRFMSFTPFEAETDTLYGLSPDGRLLASRDDEAETVTLASTEDPAVWRTLPGVGHSGWTEWGGADWRPDGSALAVGQHDGTVLTVALRGPPTAVRVASGSITSLDHTADGESLVVADDSGWVRHVERSTGRVLGRPVQLDEMATDVSAAGDGTWALALTTRVSGRPNEIGRVDSWARIDLEDGAVRTGRLPDLRDQDWLGVDLDPDDPTRAAVLGTRGVLVLDLDTGEPVGWIVAAHTDGIVLGGYTEDGSRIVVGGDDGRVSVWDGEDGRLLDVAVVDLDESVAPVMLRDGVTVVAATRHGTHRWDTRIGPALVAACRAAGRSMTLEEWRTYVGEDVPYRATCR